MDKIAITGGIATGKSSVGRLLEAAGLVGCDCDEVVDRLYQTAEVKDILQSRLGLEAFRPDGSVDKWKLRQYALEHPEIYEWLQEILWPRVREEVELWLFARSKQKVPRVFVQASHLFGAGMSAEFDEIWLVTAARQTVLERLQARDRLTRAQAEQQYRLSRDKLLEVGKVQVIIRNQGTLPQLKKQVSRLLNQRNWV